MGHRFAIAALMIVSTAMLFGPGLAVAGSTAGSQLNAAVVAAPIATASANWAGYAAVVGTASVTHVNGAWVEPNVTCKSTGMQYAAFWVGIDGYGSSTVEQTGTLAYCASGIVTYYAWWELYPTNSIQVISTISVNGGDHITASVGFASGTFTMTINDGSQHFSKVGNQRTTTAARTSAECIVERPSTGSSLTALAKFGTVKFSTCKAKIGGVAGGIGSFATVYQINMENIAATHLLASTSALGSTQSSFSDKWKAYS